VIQTPFDSFKDSELLRLLQQLKSSCSAIQEVAYFL